MELVEGREVRGICGSGNAWHVAFFGAEERRDVVGGRLCLNLDIGLELWLDMLALDLFSGLVDVQFRKLTQLLY